MVFIPVPVGLTYKTTLRGHCPKLVTCDKCKLEYVYLLEETAAGEGTSLMFADNEGARQRSAAAAEAVLREKLHYGVAPVPCPSCGTIQDHMIPRARQLYRRWMRTVGLIGLAPAAVLSIPAVVYTLIDSAWAGLSGLTIGMWSVVGSILAISLGLVITRAIIASRYNPNDLPLETRIQQAKWLAVSKEVFLGEGSLP
jgi:hypothetical protein